MTNGVPARVSPVGNQFPAGPIRQVFHALQRVLYAFCDWAGITPVRLAELAFLGCLVFGTLAMYYLDSHGFFS